MLRAIALSLVLCFALAAPAAAQVHTPPPGSAERRAVLDGLRPAIEREFGVPVGFVVDTLRVSGDWAFVVAHPQRRGGGALMTLDENADGVRTEAILRRQDGRWVVLDWGIGATDAWYVAYCERTPPNLMFNVCS